MESIKEWKRELWRRTLELNPDLMEWLQKDGDYIDPKEVYRERQEEEWERRIRIHENEERLRNR